MFANNFKKISNVSVPLMTRSFRSAAVMQSMWTLTPCAPDKILKLNAMYKDDSNPNKINVGAGTYKDDSGKPVVLEAVKKASALIQDMDHEYAPIDGVADFIKSSCSLVYGKDNELVTSKSKHLAAVQTLSGTGGCRVIFELLALMGTDKPIYVPNPTWPNHNNIIRCAGLQSKTYSYYEASSNTLDINGMLNDLKSLEKGSYILLHACAHNPTGIDPTKEQWKMISDVCKEMDHVTIFDCAYQGFATGDVDNDSFAIQLFVEEGHNIMLSQSFAKNFGLYGERVGCVSIITDTKADADCLLSHLKQSIIRPMYSSPPLYGARLVHEILSNPELTNLWKVECKAMADRINTVRASLRENLEQLQNNDSRVTTKRSWVHITDQTGMFCYSGLKTDEVSKLREVYSIYCTDDGRFSMAGINSSNVQYLAQSIHYTLFGKN